MEASQFCLSLIRTLPLKFCSGEESVDPHNSMGKSVWERGVHGKGKQVEITAPPEIIFHQRDCMAVPLWLLQLTIWPVKILKNNTENIWPKRITMQQIHEWLKQKPTGCGIYFWCVQKECGNFKVRKNKLENIFSHTFEYPECIFIKLLKSCFPLALLQQHFGIGTPVNKPPMYISLVQPQFSWC